MLPLVPMLMSGRSAAMSAIEFFVKSAILRSV
jgi:hypothetical protein